MAKTTERLLDVDDRTPLLFGEPDTTKADVAECKATITAANQRFESDFGQWIKIVGDQLRTAQRLLAQHHDGFDRWVREEFGWSRSHTYRIMEADATLAILSPVGDVSRGTVDRGDNTAPPADPKPLPGCERHLRELAKLPAAKVPVVWETVVETSKRDDIPITSRLIQKVAAPHRESKPEPTPPPKLPPNELNDVIDTLVGRMVRDIEAISQPQRFLAGLAIRRQLDRFDI